jgi:hypothetical protein
MTRTTWPLPPKVCPLDCSTMLKRSHPYDIRRHIANRHINDPVPEFCPKEDCQIELNQFESLLDAYDNHINQHMFRNVRSVRIIAPDCQKGTLMI